MQSFLLRKLQKRKNRKANLHYQNFRKSVILSVVEITAMLCIIKEKTMNIGSRLKQILEEQGMTVSQLSREAEVSAQTIYAMIKRDSNKADMDIMARILEALDMDLMEFLQLEPRKKKKASAKKTGEKQTEKKASVKEVEETSVQEEKEIVEEVVERPRRREIEDYLL